MSEDIIASTQDRTDTIEPINRDTVHLICSGQVVLSLAIAVKELVENAIDAGATIINIHLKEYGADLIEVADNGKGVERENFKALALKHYTSKIKKFEDLSSLNTLGFRGEALSSLCALSNVTILTKHLSADYASLIAYDHNGQISKVEIGAREQGTTVSLQNLFLKLPVRRREFMKNLKREFHKMSQLLYGYCLVSKGVKFSCTNSLKNGGRNTVVSTQGSLNVKDNIINLFSNKQLATLIDVDILRPSEEDLANYKCDQLPDTMPLPFSLEFLVSSVVHGSGRSTSDRQFFYVNSRPCEYSRLSNLINEIYRQFNKSQYPFVYLNVVTESLQIDVNVTPDKRKVFLEKENILLATIRTSLIDVFKSFSGTYEMDSFSKSQNSTIIDFFNRSTDESQVRAKRSAAESDCDSDLNSSILERFKKRSKTQNDKGGFNLKKKTTSDSNLNSFVSILPDTKTDINKKDSTETRMEGQNTNDEVEEIDKLEKNDQAKNIRIREDEVAETIEDDDINVSNKSVDALISNQKLADNTKFSHESPMCPKIKINDKAPKISNIVNLEKAKHSKLANDANVIDGKPVTKQTDSPIDDSIQQKKSIRLDWSLETIKQALKSQKTTSSSSQPTKVRFRSEILPKSSKSAEQELQKHISKEDFAKMDIIGQFNHGFIITKLENDLFVIDQHATDEKYNFEQLQANTVMETQVLVRPKPLELTAANECLLIDHEEVFKKNGFQFKIDESAPCTKKVSLVSIPLSKSTIFGKDDIDQMLFMLRESNHSMVRPPRIRDMFASRACRSSVMVGKALSIRDMRRLVDHMGEIEQPWNCPHGRPTMRHLINLDLIDDQP